MKHARYYEKRNYDGMEMWMCRYEKEWTVLQKIVVATILIAAFLGAGYLETFFLNLNV